MDLSHELDKIGHSPLAININDLTIQKLDHEDCKEFMVLLRETLYSKDPDCGMPASKQRLLEQIEDCIESRYEEIIVAKKADQIIATVSLGPLHGLEPSEKIGEIRDLVVQKQFRGLGLGKYLLKMALKKAIGYGYIRIYLEISSEMNTAGELFQRFGFRPVLPRKNNMNPAREEEPCYFVLEDVQDLMAMMEKN